MCQAKVSVAQTHGGLADAVGQVLRPYAARARGGRVLVKPNLHGGHGYVAPEVLDAVLQWTKDCGAAEVVVGEGPYWGMSDFERYAEQIGAAEVCRRHGVRLINLHEHEYDIVRPEMPALPERLGVSKWLAWADLSISVPVMKTHLNTLVTLAFKNLKGLIRPQDKRDIHTKDLHLAVAALPLFVQPDVHLLDATVAYEGMGPGNATPVEMGLVMASADPFALDCLGAWLMGIEPAKLRYLREAERLGLGRLPAGGDAVAALADVAPERLGGWRRQFKLPYEAAEAEYPDLRISTKLACSGCVMNLFSALRELKAEGMAEGLRGTVAVGKPPEQVDLAVGNCTFAAWDGAAHLPGCPPTIAEIKRALQETLAVE